MLLLTAMAIAAAVAGCGGSDDGTSSASGGPTIATSSLSKEEFIKQAGAACQKERKNILEESLAYLQKHEKSKKPSRAEETELFADMTRAVVVPTIEKEIAAIRKLGAPSGDEDEIATFVNAEEDAAGEVAKLKQIVSRFQMERYLAPSAKLARAYGLSACANGE
jgi:hypothetical protein